ncbi:UvrD-helicase domain-containing protein [Aureisphaera galaxeae]|uniref:UvrD-helicase domain-containing protein n=1 Tax=Aureisphaera galaxeae TaxID=1538023 RepID=UPI0023503BF1|nr:UvrD-helicase domain-containing protein [Aureisphaera galaxeae]MDC8005233.1 UvrD-helicase domain-containing protein [Aureisphaera galaxeae]
MNSSASFKVYNASAGSGKTFALVKAYLVQILLHPQNGYYKHLLGITFTNKAVAEMKERIVATLSALSKDEVPKEFKGMHALLLEETNLDEEKIRDRSRKILKHLLHHYAQFSIETIDSFNHRLIRTFAHDLKLASNFEVSLDTDEILSKAVDQFIEKAGTDEEITELLLEFALRKTDEDKSWDISFDLKKTASLLASENDLWHLQSLREKSIADFRNLQQHLQKETKVFEKEITETATQLFQQLSEKGIPEDVFQRGTFPNHFRKLQNGDYDVYKNKLEEYLEVGGSKLYKAQTPEGIREDIDALTPSFLDTYRACKTKVHQIKLYKNILKNLVPLAALNGVYQEIEQIKEDENILPISEFNSLIFSEIKDQPAPFIYERLGDRYRHFFIDEFQDTSKLQWENLIPLIDNALSQTTLNDEMGSLLLVGDAKQSIYRWRGGLPEQFMNLSQEVNPFSIEHKELVQLETNYRSNQEIIDFNNGFFQFASQHFGNAFHSDMYETGSQQKHTNKTGGYIQVGFIEAQNKEEEHELYPRKVYEALKDLLERGYNPKDICILTRRKKDGVIISEYLLETDPSISIVSEETLLLKNSEVVVHLIHLLQLAMEPHNEEVKINVLEFLYDHFEISQEMHAFYSEFLGAPMSHLSDMLLQFDIQFSFEVANQLPLYECFEYCIASLRLSSKMDAFAHSFMDLVFRFSQRPGVGKIEFLEYWETEKEKASITSNSEADAVRLMTIHKSKGLEFPVVIFPYADVNLYTEIEPKSWFPWAAHGFDHLLIDYKKELEDSSPLGAAMVQQRRETLELDNINLLYVALTRPKKELYVFAKKETIKQPPTSYNQILIAYLNALGLWVDSTNVYQFGKQTAPDASEKGTKHVPVSVPYTTSNPESHNLNIVTSSVYDTEDQAIAIGLGNLFHDTMAKINTLADLETILGELEASVPEEENTMLELKKMVKNVVHHPELKPFFENPYLVYNERDIATPTKMIRPDRVVIHSDETATVIDYKTGAHNPKYVEQIYDYADALEAMGFSVREKLLVYCNTDGIMINKA